MTPPAREDDPQAQGSQGAQAGRSVELKEAGGFDSLLGHPSDRGLQHARCKPERLTANRAPLTVVAYAALPAGRTSGSAGAIADGATAHGAPSLWTNRWRASW